MAQPATTRQVGRALARASRGQSLDRAEVSALLQAEGEDALRLAELARRLRDDGLAAQGRSGVVTYSPKVFVPLTRLCRDRCRYCAFATTPGDLAAAGQGIFLEPHEVVAIARAGAAAGCAEAMFALGDRPEARWKQARRWLDERGYDSTTSYLRAMAILVLEETGLLPHLNPGVMSWDELARLRPVAASMGLMLETSSRRLFADRDGPHFGSPDKDPAVRLRTIEDAGRLAIPFTTGLLVGIGETPLELADSVLDLRRVAREFGHVQEVIIQPFRAKPGTAMARHLDLPVTAYANALAVARIVLGPSMSVQAPPNLCDLSDVATLLDAGVDDWGGVSPVTADHVNPERSWPELESLRRATGECGFELRPRLTVHPNYVNRSDRWVAPTVAKYVAALGDCEGLLRAGAVAAGASWQEAARYGDIALAGAGDEEDLRVDVDLRDRPGGDPGVFGDWDEVAARSRAVAHVARLAADVRAALDLAANQPEALADPANELAAVELMSASGDALMALAAIADRIRSDRVGDTVTYVVNRNINFTNVCYSGCRFCAFAQRETDPEAYVLSLTEVGDRVAEAAAAGATEICMQGGIHPKLPGTAYFDLAAEAKRRAPGIHLHAFSPMEVHNGATRCGMSMPEFLAAARDAGVDSLPGTAAEILDDEVRWVLTKGKLPAQAWVEIITAAHELGIPTTATMMYGHVDQPVHWVRHLRLLRSVQERTGGFTEFVGLPYVHHNAPLHLAGISRPGPTPRDDLAVTAMARIMLAGAIDNIQVSWVKLGAGRCTQLLAAGANDVGGTLMEETISRLAGSEHGYALTVEQLRGIADDCGRPARERTTLYEPVQRASVETGVAGRKPLPFHAESSCRIATSPVSGR